MVDVTELGKRGKEAAKDLARASTALKNNALEKISQALKSRVDEILEANESDMQSGRDNKISTALLDRLYLNEDRIIDIADALVDITKLKDPIGQVVEGWRLPNGLQINKVRVPLGLIGMIYEARPNVTVDAAGLCLKTGNAVILRGGSLAYNSNLILTQIIDEAAAKAGLPRDSVQMVTSTDRKEAGKIMKLNQYIDVLIPRGSESLINRVIDEATVPVIETGIGNCHVYVDQEANLKSAKDIIINAKCQRPGVCNAAETLLIHESVAEKFIPGVIAALQENKVEIFGDKKVQELASDVKPASEEDWKTEYLDLKLAVKVVDSLDEAIKHINKYGSKHSEAIITEDYSNAFRFTDEVDAAAVYVNASTRFTDGGEFGLGAEIGISTQKLHARGPMGLEALTSTKYVIYGKGQIRQ